VDAKKISPDPDDVLYFAAAIRIRCGIWSNDKKLKNQEQIPVYSTHDLKNIF
jgi:predicted nucleic acid-binding protein